MDMPGYANGSQISLEVVDQDAHVICYGYEFPYEDGELRDFHVKKGDLLLKGWTVCNSSHFGQCFLRRLPISIEKGFDKDIVMAAVAK